MTTKPPNFSEYITDYSPGCYLTNYLITAITIFYAYKYSLTYLDLNQNYQFFKKIGYFRQSHTAEKNYQQKLQEKDIIINENAADIRRRKRKDKNGNEKSPSYLSSYPYIFDQFLLNKKMLCLYIILTNIFVGGAVFFSGLVHQFFYDETKVLAKMFWSAGVVSLGLNIFFNIMFPLFLIIKISTIIQYRIILAVTGILASLLAFEELIWEKMSFGLLTILAAIFMALSSFFPTVMKNRILTDSFRVGFRPKLLYPGLAGILFFTGYYLKIRPGCSVALAFEKGLCPFPDFFNHNAMLHVALAFTYWGLNRSFSRIFW